MVCVIELKNWTKYVSGSYDDVNWKGKSRSTNTLYHPNIYYQTVTKLYVKNEAYQVIEEILDRRSRKGLSTFILSRASLEDISARDIKGDFKAIKRDGLDDCKYPAIIRYTDQFSRRSM